MTSESFPEIAAALQQTIDHALPLLRALPADRTGESFAPGKWSAKQVIGHLIDSASNNHQRFVRAQEAPTLVFPPYAQEHWVASQHYGDREWDDLVLLWHAYNRHVAHVIDRIGEEFRDVPCTIGASAPVTLGFLAADYGNHLRHHLRQVIGGE